jgi:RNA polymerase sigma-70 factor (ECF subfamily)
MDLDAAIAELPHGARTIFVLHDVEGYRHEEIAGMLGISAGTSKSQLHRARHSLRSLLGRVTEKEGAEKPPITQLRSRRS